MGAMEQIRKKVRKESVTVEGVKVDVMRLTRPEYETFLERIKAVAAAPEGEEPETEAQIFSKLFFEVGSDNLAFTPEFIEAEIPIVIRKKFIAAFFKVQGGEAPKN